ncbi:MAG: phosphoglycerate dehydrogenase [Cyclobacteriaceae bacterium]
MADKLFIIDFDSTFIKSETLDLLGEISLSGHPDKKQRLGKIAAITNSGMNGDTSFATSLKERIALLQANELHLDALITQVKKEISTSVQRNKQFFIDFAEQIYIVSSGFREFIVPVVADYGIDESHVYANTFTYDDDQNIIGFDTNNPLSQDQGKVKLMESLKLTGDISVIGDGYTDYEIKEAGYANRFYAYTENVSREKVISKADHITPSFDEFLYVNHLPMVISYPKNRIKALLLENVHADAVAKLKKEGYSVELLTGALDEDELIEKIKDVSLLGLRSKTNVTAKVLAHANKLKAIGAFCIGTNQIDLKECSKLGIPVFNAPYSNTRSVVELAIAEIIMLLRAIPDKNAGMHVGDWKKSAVNSFEARKKKLGIVGYGNIGTQLSTVAEALGMQVYFYDMVDKLALGNAIKCDTLKELLSQVDVVSLHVDGRPSNKLFFGKDDFDNMKQGSYFVNLSRGAVVDLAALKENIESGKIKGAGIDVFPEEPKTNKEKFNSELKGLPNTILTPHIGGSTSEAQVHIGNYVPEKFTQFINAGSTYGSVNFPNMQLQPVKNAHRIIHIHQNVPGTLVAINQILTKYNCNIVGQTLKTSEEIGYVITDVNQKHGEEMIEELKNVPNTIRFRVLY